MARQFHSYEPAKGHGLPHDPFNAIVAPRPIGWISSRDAQGQRQPRAAQLLQRLLLHAADRRLFLHRLEGHCSQRRRKRGEFGWSLVTKPLAEAMNATSAAVPHGVNEFELAGLTEAPSRLIDVPRVAESPVSFECKLTQMFRLQTKEGQEAEILDDVRRGGDGLHRPGSAEGRHLPDRRRLSDRAQRRAGRLLRRSCRRTNSSMVRPGCERTQMQSGARRDDEPHAASIVGLTGRSAWASRRRRRCSGMRACRCSTPTRSSTRSTAVPRLRPSRPPFRA